MLQRQQRGGGHGQYGLDDLMGKTEAAQVLKEKDRGVEGICMWLL